MEELLWPLRGVWLFVRTPSWWVRPLLTILILQAALFGIGLLIIWLLWPTEASGLMWWLSVGLAIGLAFASVLFTWTLMLPLLMSFLLEDLARKANAYAKALEAHQPSHGSEIPSSTAQALIKQDEHELAMVPGLLAGLKVMTATLPLRFGWMGASLITGIIISPLGAVVSAIGMGHIACIDAVDISLSLRGRNGNQRLAALHAHRLELRQAAVGAGLLHIALSVTVIGWLLWLPGIVVGAALRTRSWTDASYDPVKATSPSNPGA
jgi:hypothetical protein